MRMRGRTALVTGASRGIGAATATRLAAEGAAVGIVARSLRPRDDAIGSLEETADRLRALGARVSVVVADLSDADERAQVVPAVVDELGPIDILVNNAAAAIFGSALTMSDKRRRLLLEVNYLAPLDLIRAVAPGMRERGMGWIVNVTSMASLFHPGPPYEAGPRSVSWGGYGASKAALERITNVLAMELHGTGVRVNAVRPRQAVQTQPSSVVGTEVATEEGLEPMESMVEAVVALCDCSPDDTGLITASLDLIAKWDLPVHSLDGTPIGQAV